MNTHTRSRMKPVYRVGLLAFLLPLMSFGQGVNTQLVGTMNIHPGGYSNCWGYVSPGGNEYALLGCIDGTSIVNITTDTLREVAFIPGPRSAWREMKVYQHYAYIVTEGTGIGAGVQIVDLSTLPDSARLIKTFLPNPQFARAHTVSQSGKYLFLNGGNYRSGGIIVCDLTDPINPVQVGEYEAEYVHDCYVRNDTIYAAAIGGQGLDILDATLKSNIRRITLVTYPGAGTHNTDLSQDGKYVFTTDEVGIQNILRVWDKSDMSNIQLIGTYTASPNSIIHNVHVKGTVAYISHYTEGVRMVDIKSPSIPVEIGSYDTYPGSSASYAGAWGTFPYYASNKVIISDIQKGLFVVRFPGQDGSLKVGRIVATVRDSLSGKALNDVKVEILNTNRTIVTDLSGKFSYGVPSDTLTVRLSRSNYWSGYQTKITRIPLKYDSMISVTLLMQPMLTGSVSGILTNTSTSQPIKNFIVRIARTPLETTTDSLGRFSFPSLLGDSTYTFVASQFGFVPDSVSKKIVAGTTNIVSLSLLQKWTDNFEYDLGWTVGSPRDSGTLGIWQRVEPVAYFVNAVPYQPANHTTGGSQCYVTDGSGSQFTNVDGRTTLISPPFDPTAMSNPVVQYWRFFFTRTDNAGDSLIVQLSNDNGVRWVDGEILVAKHNSWVARQLVVKNVLPVTGTMRIRFIVVDGASPSVVEGAIDDFEVGDNLPVIVGGQPVDNRPLEFSLSQNYPNPFNPRTAIAYQLSAPGSVTLKVYDVLGREVAVVVNDKKAVGTYTVEWDASRFASGSYFYRLQAGSFTVTKIMNLLK